MVMKTLTTNALIKKLGANGDCPTPLPITDDFESYANGTLNPNGWISEALVFVDTLEPLDGDLREIQSSISFDGTKAYRARISEERDSFPGDDAGIGTTLRLENINKSLINISCAVRGDNFSGPGGEFNRGAQVGVAIIYHTSFGNKILGIRTSSLSNKDVLYEFPLNGVRVVANATINQFVAQGVFKQVNENIEDLYNNNIVPTDGNLTDYQTDVINWDFAFMGSARTSQIGGDMITDGHFDAVSITGEFEELVLGQGDQNICFGIDAVIGGKQKPFKIDVLLKKESNQETFIIDSQLSLIITTFTETLSTDAILSTVAIVNKNFSIDSLIVVGVFDENYLINGILIIRNTANNAITDGLLVNAGKQKLSNIDSILLKKGIKPMLVDGVTFIVPSELINIDSFIKTTKTITTNIDSNIKLENQANVVIDAILKLENSTIYNIDAKIIQGNQILIIIDSVISPIKEKEFMIDSITKITEPFIILDVESVFQ